MIRFIIGLSIVFFALGTLDYATNSDMIIDTIIALIGLVIMISGINKFK
jgi:NADH:ubiquinone oxidoreductase subunit 2 (subunit N)